jgi:hypothetical protein
MKTKRAGFGCLVAAALLLFRADGLLAAHPEITAAEKAACEIVAQHLMRGPEAFVSRVSADSAFASLSPDARLREVAARVGPKDDALWELRTTTREFAPHGAVFYVVFPSGVDDVVTIDLVLQNDRWMIRSLRTLAEVEASKVQTDATTKERADIGYFPFVLLLLAPVVSIPAAALRHRLPRSTSVVLMASLIAFATGVAILIDPGIVYRVRGETPKRTAASMIAMGDLDRTRAALARGTKTPDLPSGTDAVTKEIAELWMAARSIGSKPSDEIRTAISSVVRLKDAPLKQLVLARLAASDGDEAAARNYFAAVQSAGPPHDAFAIEELLVSAPHAKPATRDTRDPNLYYTQILHVLATRDAPAIREAFQQAWTALPVSRSRLVSSGIFSILLADAGLASLVNLNSAEERATAAPALGRSPMNLPHGARATVCGAYLRIVAGSSRLDVPGGSAIAPASTAVVTGDELERQESAEALRTAQSLGSPSLSSSAMQRTVGAAADALAARNRWSDIETLTRAVRPESEGLPISLVLTRARALVRLKRGEEARVLALGHAGQQAVGVDVSSLLELSEIMAAAGKWDDGLSLVRRASQLKGAPDISNSLRRLELRRSLAESPVIFSTAHFSIHGTPDVTVMVAERVGQLLEAELQRLSGALSTNAFQPIHVNVTQWDEFTEQLTGSEHIVGFYDGEITVPFGEVAQFREGVVSILSHELTHAIVAQQSLDNAPRWFQEGLATRMELTERQENIFQLHPDRQFVALSVLDATLGESLNPNAVADAYTVASTLIRFIEDRYGRAAIGNLINAFREGKETNEALFAALGVRDLSALDVEFRQWGMTHNEAFVDKTPWPYWQFYSPGIDPKIRNSIRFSRRPAEGQR